MEANEVLSAFRDETKQLRWEIRTVVLFLLSLNLATIILSSFGDAYFAVVCDELCVTAFAMVADTVYNICDLLVFFYCKCFRFKITGYFRTFFLANEFSCFVMLLVRNRRNGFHIACVILLYLTMLFTIVVILLYRKLIPGSNLRCLCCYEDKYPQVYPQTVHYVISNQPAQLESGQVIYQQQPTSELATNVLQPESTIQNECDDLPPAYNEVVKGTSF